MGESTLYDKAVANYRSAQLILAQQDGDEELLNLAAFHLQQALELSMKYVLELNGVEYPRTHGIEQLIALARERQVNLYVSDYIDDHAEMFSQWEAKARYIIGYQVELRKVTKALQEVDEYLAAVATGESCPD